MIYDNVNGSEFIDGLVTIKNYYPSLLPMLKCKKCPFNGKPECADLQKNPVCEKYTNTGEQK